MPFLVWWSQDPGNYAWSVLQVKSMELFRILLLSFMFIILGLRWSSVSSRIKCQEIPGSGRRKLIMMFWIKVE